MITKVRVFFEQNFGCFFFNYFMILAVTDVTKDFSMWNNVLVTPLEKVYSAADMEPCYGSTATDAAEMQLSNEDDCIEKF